MRLVWAPTALHHLAEARDYVAQDKPDAAEALVSRLTEVTETLALFPQAGRAMGDGRRILSVPGTPFRLVYRPLADRILIIAVWHGARQWPSDPR